MFKFIYYKYLNFKVKCNNWINGKGFKIYPLWPPPIYTTFYLYFDNDKAEQPAKESVYDTNSEFWDLGEEENDLNNLK
jgi:hypothetical protein